MGIRKVDYEMTDDVIIKTENLHYSYEDGTKALQGIDLELKRGKRIAFLGANGSGKSTFFLCLNGVLKPQKGTLYYEGHPYYYTRKELLALRSKVGIVFQDPDNQLFSASVFQEISFGALNMGMSEEAARERVTAVIGELNITPFKNKPTHALSGGQKKQVSIADILVMNPEVIILDEPAAALDPKHVEIVNGVIEGLTKRGITVLISTHDVDYAYRWADEVVLFHEGKVLLQGETQFVFGQREILEKTHLKQPAVLEMFGHLCQKGILEQGQKQPKTLKQLENQLEEIKTISKKAILVVSFGTSHEDTREKTIDAIEREIAADNPNHRIYRAWTSNVIIRKLEKQSGIHINTVTEAIKQIIADGITELTVQPTHIMNGIENDRMKEEIKAFRGQLSFLAFGNPLLTTNQDNIDVIQTLMARFSDVKQEEALVFMGHGTTHYANTVYAALDYAFKESGYGNVFVGTVEAFPSIETVLKAVKEYKPQRVILTPLMIVAGEHAKNDMAGEGRESWSSRFKQAGFQVECVVKGLGEYEGIRHMLKSHVKEARGTL